MKFKKSSSVKRAVQKLHILINSKIGVKIPFFECSTLIVHLDNEIKKSTKNEVGSVWTLKGYD